MTKKSATKRRAVTPSDPAIAKIAATRGLAMRIAEACGVSRQAISDWKRVPPQHVMIVSRLIGMRPEKIRPDIFGRAAKRKTG